MRLYVQASVRQCCEQGCVDRIFEYDPVSFEKLFSSWHNHRYLKQCYYNLQEKFDCGGISEEEWIKIKNKFEEKLNH